MRKSDIVVAIAVCLSIGVFLAPFASSFPDGLEWAAQKLGFMEKAREEPVVAAPAPDYAFPGIGSEFWATALSGLAGTTLVLGMGYLLGRLLKKGKS